jgi:hypothetical protein
MIKFGLLYQEQNSQVAKRLQIHINAKQEISGNRVYDEVLPGNTHHEGLRVDEIL